MNFCGGGRVCDLVRPIWPQVQQFQPLHLAAGRGFGELVRLLLESGARHCAVDVERCQALHLAAESGSVGAVRALVEAGADARARNKDGEPLHLAAFGGHAEVVRLLLEGGGAYANAKDQGGWQALTVAARKGFLGVVRVLIDGGADVCAICPNGSQPLHYAAQYGHVEIVKSLLAAGADIGAECFSGAALVRMFLRGPDAINDYRGLRPLDYALERGFIDVVRVLIDAGANLETVTRPGLLKLFLAADFLHSNDNCVNTQEFFLLLTQLDHECRDVADHGNVEYSSTIILQTQKAGLSDKYKRVWHITRELADRYSDLCFYLTDLLKPGVFASMEPNLAANPGLVQRLEQFHDVYVRVKNYVVAPGGPRRNVAFRFFDFLDHQHAALSDRLLDASSPDSIMLLARLFCIFVWQHGEVLTKIIMLERIMMLDSSADGTPALCGGDLDLISVRLDLVNMMLDGGGGWTGMSINKMVAVVAEPADEPGAFYKALEKVSFNLQRRHPAKWSAFLSVILGGIDDVQEVLAKKSEDL